MLPKNKHLHKGRLLCGMVRLVWLTLNNVPVQPAAIQWEASPPPLPPPPRALISALQRTATDCCCLAAFGDLARALYGCWSSGAAVKATRNRHVQPSSRPVLLVPVRTLLPETFAVHGAARVQNLRDEQETPVPDRGEFGHRSTHDSCSLGKLRWPVRLENAYRFTHFSSDTESTSDETVF